MKIKEKRNSEVVSKEQVRAHGARLPGLVHHCLLSQSSAVKPAPGMGLFPALVYNSMWSMKSRDIINVNSLTVSPTDLLPLLWPL